MSGRNSQLLVVKVEAMSLLETPFFGQVNKSNYKRDKECKSKYTHSIQSIGEIKGTLIPSKPKSHLYK